MSYRDRATHHIEPRLIHFSNRPGKSCAHCPLSRLEPAKIRKDLRSERLVHLDEIDVPQCQSCTSKSNRRSKHWRLKELLTWVERSVRIRPDVAERLVSERLCFFFTHQEHARATVGEGRGISRGHASIFSVEHRLQCGKLLEARVGPDPVVRGDDAFVSRRNVDRHFFGGETSVGSPCGCEAMRAQSKLVLLLARDVVQLRHFFGGLPHRLARRRLCDGRSDGNEIFRPHT